MKTFPHEKTDILVAVRISGAANSKRRPAWFTKDVCVRSVIRAVEEFRHRGGSANMALLVDISSGMSVNEADRQYGQWFNQVIGVYGGSAARSWRSSIRALRSSGLLESAHLLYFVEDDHLHTGDAIARLAQGSADYRFAYASDEDLAVPLAARQATVSASLWIPVESGVTSFAVRSRIFRRDVWKHVAMSHGGRGWDELTFRALGLGARRILGQGWKYALAPFGEAISVRESLGAVRHSTFRAAAQVIGAFAPKISVEAMIPPSAAHAEVNKLPGGRDWDQVASGVSVSD